MNDPYRNTIQALAQKDGINVILIDPEKLKNPDMDANIKAYKKMIAAQSDVSLESIGTDESVANNIRAITSNLPITVPSVYGSGHCLVTLPQNDFRTQDQIVTKLSGIDAASFSRITPTAEQLQSGVAAHEYEHCSHDKSYQHDSSLSDKQKKLLEWQDEKSADVRMKSYLTQTAGANASNFMMDIRALGSATVAPPTHITATFVRSGVMPNAQSLETVSNFRQTIYQDVSDVSGIPVSQLQSAEGLNYFMGDLGRLLESGHYDDRPVLKAHVSELNDAYGRQIKGQDIPIRKQDLGKENTFDATKDEQRGVFSGADMNGDFAIAAFLPNQKSVVQEKTQEQAQEQAMVPQKIKPQIGPAYIV